MMNGYQQTRPIEAFRAQVDVYWINRPDAGAADVRVLPDGCIDLVFRSDAEGGQLFASALIERPRPIGTASDWFVGVRFRPAMARAILDIDPVAHATARCRRGRSMMRLAHSRSVCWNARRPTRPS